MRIAIVSLPAILAIGCVDAEPRVDAGPTCTTTPGSDIRLRCPPDHVLLGDRFDVGVDTVSGLCCARASAGAIATLVDASHVSLEVTMDLCECQPSLPCASQATTSVSIVAATVGRLTVTSGSASCLVDVDAQPP